jgi:biotin carboxyl carrier protein
MLLYVPIIAYEADILYPLLQKGDLKLAIYRVKVEGTWYNVEVGDVSKSPVTVQIDGEEFHVEIEPAEQPETSPQQETPTPAPPPRPAPTPAPPPVRPAPNVPTSGTGGLSAPMPGVIVEVLVSEGEKVTRGQDICILEAMKMQQRLKAAQDGIVTKVHVEATQRVQSGDQLIDIEPGNSP